MYRIYILAAIQRLIKMRRLFIIRKDLNMKPGKLAAMICHCCEAYWINLLKTAERADIGLCFGDEYTKRTVRIPMDIWNDYVNGIFTKTICECKNLNHLKKAEELISEVNLGLPKDSQLIEGQDYGYINDKCLTDLTPENPDGTCTIGIWFRPLPDEIAHKISRKYKLYGAFDK